MENYLKEIRSDLKKRENELWWKIERKTQTPEEEGEWYACWEGRSAIFRFQNDYKGMLEWLLADHGIEHPQNGYEVRYGNAVNSHLRSIVERIRKEQSHEANTIS